MPAWADLWGYLLVALVFFVIGRLSVERGSRRNVASDPDRPGRSSASANVRPQPLPADLETELRELLVQGHLIQAIKRYREATGANLKTAKDAVLDYQKRLRQRGPL